ncbi:hypothetical protein [Phaeobacter gallaeciensis]|uniref:hypothetical protein n=1 Tax=Phaeobacter gallaeciensis TaxID=60890 RepID=UPI0003D6AE08|nr:hypothetical protein [Phaeobacter gallaeciensis]AHD12143.1 hypothetical protein Gal_04439 [Phaeobacter gallaeciensis DSM 26640]ATE95327.1 hypothetical protein PhaeoP11_04343 [Phaeobacter gallaeciensis]
MSGTEVGVKGEDNIVKIGSGDPVVYVTIEHQGDATYNGGISQNKKKTKTGSVPFQQKDGAQVTFTMTKMRPLQTGQQMIWDAAENGSIVPIVYEDPNPGGHRREGMAQVSFGEEGANVEGLVDVPFTIAFIADPNTTTNP